MSGNKTYLLSMTKDEINLLADAMKHYRVFMAKTLTETIRLGSHQMYTQYKTLGKIMDLTKDVIEKRDDEPATKDDGFTELYEKDATYKKDTRVCVPGVGKATVIGSGVNSAGKEVTRVKLDTGVIASFYPAQLIPVIDIKDSVEEIHDGKEFQTDTTDSRE